jgi:hypothetical protein
VLKEKHKFRGSIPFPLMSKGESCRQGRILSIPRRVASRGRILSMPGGLCVSFSSMTKGEIVGIIVIDVKGLMMSLMSYYRNYNTHNISKIDLYI